MARGGSSYFLSNRTGAWRELVSSRNIERAARTMMGYCLNDQSRTSPVGDPPPGIKIWEELLVKGNLGFSNLYLISYVIIFVGSHASALGLLYAACKDPPRVSKKQS